MPSPVEQTLSCWQERERDSLAWALIRTDSALGAFGNALAMGIELFWAQRDASLGENS